MKTNTHPENYRLVIFKDMSNEYMFLGKSCTETRETVKWEDGNEYPLIKLDISHKSHPLVNFRGASVQRSTPPIFLLNVPWAVGFR